MHKHVSLVHSDAVVLGRIRLMRRRMWCSAVIRFTSLRGSPPRQEIMLDIVAVVAQPLEYHVSFWFTFEKLGHSEGIWFEKWYDDEGSILHPFSTFIQGLSVDGT